MFMCMFEPVLVLGLSVDWAAVVVLRCPVCKPSLAHCTGHGGIPPLQADHREEVISHAIRQTLSLHVHC